MARSVITIEGLESFKVGLSDLQQQQYPYSMSQAINETAAKVRTAAQARMTQDFDRPTPFTLNALRINYASKSNLSGGVEFKDPTRLTESQHYLYPNVYGVKRGFKKFEAALYARGLIPAGWYAVPGKDQPLDSYGNVPAGLMREILAWFGANTQAEGYTSNMTDATRAKRKAGTRKTFGYEFFALRKANGSMLPGIYRRVFFGDYNKIYSIFIFVNKTNVGYQRVYKFHEAGRQAFDANFAQSFGTWIEYAVNTAIPKK